MNPLTKAATHNLKRENAIITAVCGVVLVALFVAYFI